MLTRCRIGIKERNIIRSICCHYDGYPEHTGQILYEMKTSETLILVLNGDIKRLNTDLSTLKFDDFDPVTDDFLIHDSPAKFFKCCRDCWADWGYFLDLDYRNVEYINKPIWFCRNPWEKTKPRPLWQFVNIHTTIRPPKKTA